MKRVTKADVARQYRDKYDAELKESFPDGLPTRKLARIMYEDNKLLFKDVEDARTILRSIEGKHPSTIKKTHIRPERVKNPYNLPESFQDKREPFKLPSACNNILLISDLHIPYHDIDAITIALDYGVKNKINTVLILGDLGDFHQISRFEKDPRKRSLKQEFEAIKDFLRILRKTFPTASLFWAKGNHCVRVEKWLMTKVYEIFDDQYYHLEERLALNEEKVTLIDDKVLIKIGKLFAAHGHHIFKGVFSPVNPARGAFMKAKQSIIVGHLHRPSHHPEIKLNGDVISCWSLGCLCETRPDYSPQVSNSQHGFAHITVEKNGDYYVRNFQIIKGKIH